MNECEFIWFMTDYFKDFSAKLIRDLEEDCSKINYRFSKWPIRKSLNSFLELLRMLSEEWIGLWVFVGGKA